MSARLPFFEKHNAATNNTYVPTLKRSRIKFLKEILKYSVSLKPIALATVSSHRLVPVPKSQL